ncbi:hypothetical protein AXG93_2646s1140 [Marchantia polymorpha subsp. ruderalis]|uniref:Uncharacterized protein n=1 Tax=Marchantia polymorpha subsp. ruderalis TaxID=1480154 RepID=A0A176W6C6_MARPO|nr:hypothetical protein AXG93_2646s1140 [Marchantia polymorpha subsp. ruderalis]
MGQDFQAEESRSSNKTMSHDSYTSKDGFVSESVFDRLIEEFLRKQPHGQRGVDKEVLENILMNLDLCFKLKDTSQYFILSFIREHTSMEEQKHQEGEHLESMAWETRDETSQDLWASGFNAKMKEQCHLLPLFFHASSTKDKLEDLPLDKSHSEKEEELFNYEHSWPMIEVYTAKVIFERARDLLWESYVEAVVNEIRQKRMQQLESL